MKKTFFNSCFAYSVIATIGTITTATDARSAVIFTETAGNAFYDSGWSSGSSQPGNFSWVVTTNVTNPGYAGHFIGDSTNLSGGSSGGNVNTVGRSLGYVRRGQKMGSFHRLPLFYWRTVGSRWGI